MQFGRLANALNDNGGDGHHRVPKYLRLSEEIANAIDSGELRAGDRLPGESEMASHLPASLGTIQKALGHLAERGIVVRRHGAGTFVAELPNQLRDLWHFRFLDDDGRSLLPVFTRVTQITRVGTGGAWTDFLGGEGYHLRIDREIDVNHEFNAASRIFLPGGRFDALANAKPDSLDNVNIRAVLRERFDAPTSRVVEQVGAEIMPDDICALLNLAPGTTGMVVHILGFGFLDEPLSYQLVYTPPNTRRLEIRPRNP
ncbi:MAG: GntR family transcriptional regulator [Rhodospirillaceae bacterium]|nr:GntR family transcriptional regulator [Rhodospirillaceae bacterium]